jgi:hypothetical protein
VEIQCLRCGIGNLCLDWSYADSIVRMYAITEKNYICVAPRIDPEVGAGIARMAEGPTGNSSPRLLEYGL